MGKGPEQTFFKEDIQMTNRHIKRRSALLTIREMEIKTTKKCHLTPVRMAVIKKTRGNKCLKDAEEKRSPCTVVELGKTVWRLLKKIKKYNYSNAWILNCVWFFATPWTAACQSPVSMGFFQQEYWSGLPSPPPGDLPNPGIKPMSPTSPTLQADSLLLSHQGSPLELPYDPAIPLVGIYLKEMKSLSWRCLSYNVHGSIIHKSQEMKIYCVHQRING